MMKWTMLEALLGWTMVLVFAVGLVANVVIWGKIFCDTRLRCGDERVNTDVNKGVGR